MSTQPPRVLVVGDRRRPGVAEGVARHRPYLERALTLVDVDLDEKVDLSTTQADLVLVFGGDGSILHVARRLGANTIPVLGVNYGRFGFLADLNPDGLEAGIQRWLEGEYETHERRRLRVVLRRDDKVVREWMALNDLVVGHRDLGRVVDVDVEISGRHAIRFAGDGLIVATPTGSSAHAAAAGGPLLDPTLPGVVIVPIAPHSLSTRPLVLSGSHDIVLRVDASRAPAACTVDGAPSVPLARTDVLDVVDAESPIALVRVSGGPFYETLRNKLGWRGRPPYATEPADGP